MGHPHLFGLWRGLHSGGRHCHSCSTHRRGHRARHEAGQTQVRLALCVTTALVGSNGPNPCHWALALKGPTTCRRCHIEDHIQTTVQIYSMHVQKCFLKFISNYNHEGMLKIPFDHHSLPYIFNVQFLKKKASWGRSPTIPSLLAMDRRQDSESKASPFLGPALCPQDVLEKLLAVWGECRYRGRPALGLEQ